MVELVFNDATAAMFQAGNSTLCTMFCVNFPLVNKNLPYSSISAVRYEAIRTRSSLEIRQTLSDVYKERYHAKPFNEGPL